MEKMIIIDIICANGHLFPVKWSVGSKVLDLKEYLADISCIDVNDQRLIYSGMTLEDDRTLDSYGLQEYHAIHMEIPNNPWFAEPETTPPSDTTTCGHGLPMEEMIMIDIICADRNMFSVTSSVRSKVVDFKELLAQISCIPANEQRLIYRGMTLEDDDRTLDSYGLKECHTIHMEAAHMIQNHEVVRRLASPQMMQAPESQLELPRQNLIRRSISSEDSAAGPSKTKNAMLFFPPIRLVVCGLLRSSDMKYPLCGGVFLAASMLAWRVCKSIS